MAELIGVPTYEGRKVRPAESFDKLRMTQELLE
jgi:hypothetical protein